MVNFIMNELFTVSAHACLYGSKTERGSTDLDFFFFFLQSHLLSAWLPNSSSEEKDLLPRVAPFCRHLGNRCRGELPGGIVDLCWLRSTESHVCCWTDTSHKNVRANFKSTLAVCVMSSVSFSKVNETVGIKNIGHGVGYSQIILIYLVITYRSCYMIIFDESASSFLK